MMLVQNPSTFFNTGRRHMRCLKKILVIMVMALFLTGTVSGPALARDDIFDVSGESMIVDFVLLRPLGIVATAGGCVFFVATLPFTVWTEKRIKLASHHLVGVPASYTFVRPLGEIKDNPENY